MFIIDTILTFGYIALVTLAFGALAYGLYALAPIVKAFIKWHFHDDNDDDWYM